MNLAAIFAGLAASLPSRVFAALGIGFITFTAYSALIDSFVSEIQDGWAGLSSDLLAYLTLGGFTDGLGIYLGAVVASMAIKAIPKIGVLPT